MINWQLVVGSAVFVVTLALIMGRPRGVPEWLVALGGGAAMVLAGIVTVEQALRTLAANLNVFGFFLGLMTISAVAEQAGFFDALARLAAGLSGSSTFLLMFNVMLIGTLITAFFTNDATALILTPVVYALVVRLRLEPMPFMFATSFIADTASFILPVSNPINVLVLTAFPHDLWHYLRHLLVPSALVIAGNIAAFMWIFRHGLSRRFDPALLERAVRTGADEHGRARYFWWVACSLGAVAAAYVLASALGLPVSLVALGGALWLVLVSVLARRLRWRQVAADISWPLFGFIAGMLLLVQGVENLGLTAGFGHWLVRLSGGQPLWTALVSVFGAAVGANAINNVPAVLVLISAIRSTATGGQIQDLMVYGTVIGADLGPNITIMGSLATMLWLIILRRRGLDISAMEYFRLGITVTPLLLALGAVALWLAS